MGTTPIGHERDVEFPLCKEQDRLCCWNPEEARNHVARLQALDEVRCDGKGLADRRHGKGSDSVKYATTALEIWTDLRERFGKESAPRAYELKQKIAGTRQDGSIVSIYYTRLRALWDESQSIFSFMCSSCNKCTCELGKKITEHIEKERLYEFLMGLDVDFNVIKTQILATAPLPILGIAYHMMAEDERHRMISNVNQVTTEPAAFKAFQKREMVPTIQKKRPLERKASKAISAHFVEETVIKRKAVSS
ncbi:putative retrotransposon gag domain-containing protein [Helianthus annuus]|nr:putative retrotransposon gag domain-containing protein [Helianthus annuus]